MSDKKAINSSHDNVIDGFSLAKKRSPFRVHIFSLFALSTELNRKLTPKGVWSQRCWA